MLAVCVTGLNALFPIIHQHNHYFLTSGPGKLLAHGVHRVGCARGRELQEKEGGIFSLKLRK